MNKFKNTLFFLLTCATLGSCTSYSLITNSNDKKLTNILSDISFDKNRLLVKMKKWGQIKLSLKPISENKTITYTNNVDVKIYIKYNLPNKICQTYKLKQNSSIFFESSAKIFSLSTNCESPLLFFIPGDVRKKYALDKTPDYCAISVTLDNETQFFTVETKPKQKIKNIKEIEFKQLLETNKSKSILMHNLMFNANQLPPYADIKISEHPTLLNV